SADVWAGWEEAERRRTRPGEKAGAGGTGVGGFGGVAGKLIAPVGEGAIPSPCPLPLSGERVVSDQTRQWRAWVCVALLAHPPREIRFASGDHRVLHGFGHAHWIFRFGDGGVHQ